MGNFAPEVHGLLSSIGKVLGHLLELKHSATDSTSLSSESFAGLCAYDLFVSFIAALMSNERYAAIQALLSGHYRCNRESVDYLAFQTFACQAPSVVSVRVFEQSSAKRKMKFVEAELVVMLHSMLMADRQQTTDSLRHPYAFWGTIHTYLEFFAEASEGLEAWLTCLAGPRPDHLKLCFEQYSDLMIPEPHSLSAIPGELERKLHMSQWGRQK